MKANASMWTYDSLRLQAWSILELCTIYEVARLLLVTTVAVGVRPLQDEEITIPYTIPDQKYLIITHYQLKCIVYKRKFSIKADYLNPRKLKKCIDVNCK